MKQLRLITIRICCILIVSCITLGTAWAQAVTITGKILDEAGEGVIGASVLQKGTTNGTITDIDGNFTLNNVPEDATLVASFIGYKTEEIKLNKKRFVTLVLKEDTQNLDEVVVVGYGVQRKSDLTGSVSSVKAGDAIKNTPSSDITSSLQGRLAGVSIVSNSGQPGSGSTIRVRGMNSLKADQGPLLVVDGFIGGTLSSLNPSDIQSIEVLKDASATAVYGSRGANGVILVTTKNPEKGKINVNYNGYANFKTPYELPDMLSPGEFAELANDYGQEYYKASGRDPVVFYTPEQVEAYKRGEGGYDYVGNVFRNMSFQHTHELSVSGSSDKTRYLISGSYNDDEGIVRNSRAQQFNYRVKVDTDIKSWLRVGVNSWGYYTTSQGPRFSQYRGVLIESMIFSNTILPKDEQGKYNNMNLLGKQYNPMGHIWEIDTENYNITNRIQGYVDVTLLEGLTFRMTQGFVFGNNNSSSVDNANSYSAWVNGNDTKGAASSVHNYSWTNQNILSYVKEFNQDHRINATAVFEQMHDNNFTNKSYATDLVSTIIGGDNTALGAKMEASSLRTIVTMMSWMGRVNYVFKNRYMMTASWRYDGSSRLAKDNRWEHFPSIALAWNVKEESFLQPVDFLSQFKARVGYGETGNQAVPVYAAYTELEAKRNAIGDLALTIKRLGTPDLRWERTQQWNGGVDLGFFNNRLTASVDVYHKLSKDVLLEVNAPMYTGFSSRLGNAAHILNKGFEITIGADPIAGRNFTWNTNVTLSKNVGTIKSLDGDKEYAVLGGQYENGYFRNIKGKKIATMWGYVSDGLWQKDQLDQAPAGTEAGSYKFKDLDGKAGITVDDMTEIGNGQPTFQWGWNNTLNYKNFDLGLFIIGVHGFDIYNYTREARLLDLSPNPEWKNRWREGNENTTIPGFVKSKNAQTPSSQFVEKGDFVKVKSITLGYTLPKSVLQKAKINNLRVYASVQNPFVFTGYSGLDPEVTLKSPLTSGIDWGYYPNGRNFLAGLSFSF